MPPIPDHTETLSLPPGINWTAGEEDKLTAGFTLHHGVLQEGDLLNLEQQSVIIRFHFFFLSNVISSASRVFSPVVSEAP